MKLTTLVYLSAFMLIIPLYSEAIEDAYVLTNYDKEQISIYFVIDKKDKAQWGKASLEGLLHPPEGKVQSYAHIPLNEVSDQDGTFKANLNVDSLQAWHPDSPNLYHFEATVRSSGGQILTTQTVRLGIRKFESRDGRFWVNNQPIFLRLFAGEGGCGCDDLDPVAVRKRLEQSKRYGFNGVRHHSHIPSEEYLAIADEVGLLVQMEIHGKIGSDPASERFKESKEAWMRMVELGRRHPCTFIYSVGNEIYRNDPGLVQGQDILYDLAKQMDPGVLVLNRSGSSPFNDVVGKYDLIERPIGEYEHTAEFARDAFKLYLQGDRKGRSDEFPIIAHEYPLVASYPNLALAGKYEFEPDWLKTTRENLERNGQIYMAEQYVHASEAIQALCRKEMLEEARKFPELDGYSMLRFTDCGNYVSGVVDDFADPKNVTAEEFLRTNGETVLLCSWNKRNFFFDDVLEATFSVSHHGRDVFSATGCRWWLMNGPSIVAKGEFGAQTVKPVDVAKIGCIGVQLPQMSGATKLVLRAQLDGPIPAIINEWPCWVFPNNTLSQSVQKHFLLWDPRNRMSNYTETFPKVKRITDPDWWVSRYSKKVVIADSWQENFYPFLNRGGRLWVISDKTWPWPEELGIFGLHITHFVPEKQAPVLFPQWDELCSKWMTICSNTRSRYGNCGTLIAPHPIFQNFPHDGYGSLQVWPLLYRAKTLQLERFPAGVEPVVRAIDSYHRGKSKGYLVELKVGRGHLLVSTLNFTQSFSREASSRYLFEQILHYLSGSDLQPAREITSNALKSMLLDFEKEHAQRKPLIQNEMPARYLTRWQSLLSEEKRIELPVYQAAGVESDRLGIYWEYAQTKWYLKGVPGDRIQWDFETDEKRSWTASVLLAGPEAQTIEVIVDEVSSKVVQFPGSEGWEKFTAVELQLDDLLPGLHSLTVVIPESEKGSGESTVQIRGVELREKLK